MTIWWLVLILLLLIANGAAFAWMALRLHDMSDGNGKAKKAKGKEGDPSYSDEADSAVEHLFDTKFREELRNRGRLHFEKVIGENAMFLQQDLRLTTSELNDYMKTEITKKLKDEFDKYEQSIMDAKQMAVESIQKTNSAIDEQREMLGNQLKEQIASEKQQILVRFEANMAEIVNHYILAAIGNQLDLDSQLNFILSELEANKQAMIEDITHGA